MPIWFDAAAATNLIQNGTEITPYGTLDALEKVKLEAGDIVRFRKGTYANKEGKPVWFNLSMVTENQCPIIIQAEKGHQVFIHVTYPPQKKGAVIHDEGHLRFRPEYLAGTTMVPLIIRDLTFIGRPVVKPQGPPDLTAKHRAANFFSISRVHDVTMQRCFVGGSADEGFLAEYTPKDDNGGFNPTARWMNAQITLAKVGLIEDCVFDAMTNFDDQPEDWRWPAGSSAPEALELSQCKDVVVARCFLGNAGHASFNMRYSSHIEVVQCYVRNRLHTGILAGPDVTHCVIHRNRFAGVGAWAKAASGGSPVDSNMCQITGTGFIIAFNVMHGDAGTGVTIMDGKPGAVATDYESDTAIAIHAAWPSHCPSGTSTRCVQESVWTAWGNVLPGQTLGSDATKALGQADTKPLLCVDGKPPVSPGCGQGGGISSITACCAGTSVKAVCEDKSDPHCPKDKMALCVNDIQLLAAKIVKPAIVLDPVTGLPTAQPPVISIRGGLTSLIDGTAILNNLILDIGQSAILLSQSPGGGCQSVLRNTLVANNVILGQRSDPTAKFATQFWTHDGKSVAVVLPHELVPMKVLGEAKPLVGMWDIPGTLEGTSGNRFLSNVIGQRSNKTLKVAGPAGKAVDWTGSGQCSTTVKACGGLQLLKFSAKTYFDEKIGVINADEKNWALPPALPAWAKSIWKVEPPEPPKIELKVVDTAPFATDWTIGLTRAFPDTRAWFYFAAVRDLNRPEIGAGNVTARGLAM